MQQLNKPDQGRIRSNHLAHANGPEAQRWIMAENAKCWLQNFNPASTKALTECVKGEEKKDDMPSKILTMRGKDPSAVVLGIYHHGNATNSAHPLTNLLDEVYSYNAFFNKCMIC